MKRRMHKILARIMAVALNVGALVGGLIAGFIAFFNFPFGILGLGALIIAVHTFEKMLQKITVNL